MPAKIFFIMSIITSRFLNPLAGTRGKNHRLCKGIVPVLFLSAIIFTACSGSRNHPDEKQKAFEWVFGDLAKPDTAMIRKVLAGPPGKRFYVDRDNDGKPDEVWFIDTDPRHHENKRPLLVRAVDEDGDLTMGGEPDLDSDLYLADWKADGTTDAAIDYEDTDGDQDVDRMGIYDYEENDGMILWWSRDDGDDNLLWYDIDYLYYQRPCQYKTHFGGDESFFAFYIKPGIGHWTPFFENPFLFFDRDGDGVTEEVLRLAGEGDIIRTVRWSFDVDNDATKEHPRDYDVSITALGPGWTPENNSEGNFGFQIGTDQADTFELRGRPAGPALNRDKTIPFLQEQIWARVMMIWDENDVNIAWDEPGNYIERWEGIINTPSREAGLEFPQIGGPNCGFFNRRFELVLRPAGPNAYYFNPSDHRIHIKNSDKTWLKVDYDGDKKQDMQYDWTDTDRDGILDLIYIDTDGDGKADDSVSLDISHIRPIGWSFGNLNDAYGPVVSSEPAYLYALNQALTAALNTLLSKPDRDEVWSLMENSMRTDHYPGFIAHRFINSDESMLYFLSLSADRKIVRLKKAYPGKITFWSAFNTARSRGDTKAMAGIIAEEFNLPGSGNNYNAWISGLRRQPEKRRVAWDNQWLPPNWGWESEKAAFRCYDGHFDLFGKRLDTLIYPSIGKSENYHTDHGGWGMDILHVGETGGCGGLVLYVDSKPYPVRNDGKPGDPVFTARLIKETSDTVTIGFTATGVGPADSPYTVFIRVSAIAGRKDAPVEVRMDGGKPGQKTALGIVLNELPVEDFFNDKTAGIMGLWGFQQPEIGWIGTGIIFPANRFYRLEKQSGEHRVVLKYRPGEILHYNIQGDWLRGHRFSRCPGKEEWMSNLKETALIVRPVQ